MYVVKNAGGLLMKRNVGFLDRGVRIVVGLALLSLLFVLEGQSRWLGLIGVIPLLTALVGYCPLYGILGLSSCPLSKRG
jgi:Inner membrane protein YgaP-like, transmembrane domain